jgi:phosphatidyl-myo-inositol dimannoside synthase
VGGDGCAEREPGTKRDHGVSAGRASESRLKMARLLLLAYEFAPFRGGIATVVEGLACGAAELGHDVHVLAPDYHADQRAADESRPYTVHRFTGDFCSILSIDKLTGFARRCREAIRSVEPDLVHGTDPQSQMALTALSRIGGSRDYILTVHGTELLRYRTEWLPRVWMAGAFGRARGIVAVSQSVRDRLERDFRAPPDRVIVSHPGISPVWRDTPVSNRVAVRASWGATDRDVVLVTLGRRVREKGHALTVEACALLPPELRDRVVYVVVGGGPVGYAEALDEAARLARVRLVLAGELDEAGAIRALDGADLFVMPSQRTPRRLEGFGLAYIEAASRGVASIAANTGGAGEAVIDGETGVVLPEAVTPGLLADALRQMILAPARRLELGEAARRRAAGFTFTRHAREVYGHFRGL